MAIIGFNSSRRKKTDGSAAFRMTIADSGAAAVEFALVVPIFMLLLIAMMVYGLYLATAINVQQLAADSARASVAGLSDDERSALAQEHASRHASDFSLLDPQRVTLSAAATAVDANQFEVSISYNTDAMPIWVFKGLLPMPDRTLTRTASIKRGGY